MIKVLLFTLILFITFGCATKQLTSKIDENRYDTFKDESYLRYGASRLEKSINPHNKGIILCHQGDIEEGLTYLQTQSEQRKKEFEYFNHLGMCYLLAQKYAKAEHYFNMGLAIKEAPAVLNNIGVLKLLLTHYDQAYHFFNKAYSMDKTVISPQFNMVQLFIEFGLIEKAKTFALALHRKGPKDPDINQSLATIYLMSTDLINAQKHLNLIPKHFQDREDIVLSRAMLYFEKKQFYKAQEILKEKNFLSYVPLKKSAQKLLEKVNKEIKELELREKEKKETNVAKKS